MSAPHTNKEKDTSDVGLAYHERVQKEYGEDIQGFIDHYPGLRKIFIEWMNKGRTIPPLLAALEYLLDATVSQHGVAERFGTNATSVRNHVALLRSSDHSDVLEAYGYLER